MNKLSYIIIFLAFIGCKSDNIYTTLHYPSKTEFEARYQHKEVVLNTTKLTYLDITGMIPAADFRKYAPLFEIIDGGKKRRILPFTRSLYMGNQKILTINKDSVFADKGYRIGELDFVMNDIFENHGKTNFYNDDFPEIARVAIEMNGNSSGKEIRELLLTITKSFDKIDHIQQDSLFLKIYFGVIGKVRLIMEIIRCYDRILILKQEFFSEKYQMNQIELFFY